MRTSSESAGRNLVRGRQSRAVVLLRGGRVGAVQGTLGRSTSARPPRTLGWSLVTALSLSCPA